MNDTIRELLRAAFTAGENSYLSDDPLACEDWIEALEPPSREGKVKVVVRGFIDEEGEYAYCEGSTDDGPEWDTLMEIAFDAHLVGTVPRFEAVLYVTKPAVEVVEDVEVVE